MTQLFSKSLITAFSFLFFIAMTPATHASENPFGMNDLATDQIQMSEDKGKCGDSMKKAKCGEGKCGDSKKKSKCGEGKCGDSKKEGKCGDSKKEGKCGDSKKEGKMWRQQERRQVRRQQER